MIDSHSAFALIQDFLKRHPVRAEQTGERSLEMSQWMRKYCRPSKKGGCSIDGNELAGYVAFDLDFIIYDYNRKIVLLLEVKTRNGKVRYSQRETLDMLDRVMRSGARLAGIRYLGLHVLRMDGLDPFQSSTISWDGESVSREECWRRVNMLDELELVP